MYKHDTNWYVSGGNGLLMDLYINLMRVLSNSPVETHTHSIESNYDDSCKVQLISSKEEEKEEDNHQVSLINNSSSSSSVLFILAVTLCVFDRLGGGKKSSKELFLCQRKSTLGQYLLQQLLLQFVFQWHLFYIHSRHSH